MFSVLITGSSRGIGLELTKQFVTHHDPPDNVIATCRNPDAAVELQSLVTRFNNLSVLQLDVNKIETYHTLVERVDSIVGENGLNVLINNAGIIYRKANIDDIVYEDYLNVLHTNTVAPVFLTQVPEISLRTLQAVYLGLVEAHLRYGITSWGRDLDAVPRQLQPSRDRLIRNLLTKRLHKKYPGVKDKYIHLDVLTVGQALLPLLKKASALNSDKEMSIKRAAVINMSSLMGSITLTTRGYWGYSESKAALNQASRLLSSNVAMFGILVVSLHPGWVKTDLGGTQAHLTVEESVSNLMEVIYNLSEYNNDTFLRFDGEEIPW